LQSSMVLAEDSMVTWRPRDAALRAADAPATPHPSTRRSVDEDDEGDGCRRCCCCCCLLEARDKELLKERWPNLAIDSMALRAEAPAKAVAGEELATRIMVW